MAAGWEGWNDWLSDSTRPVTDQMVEALAPQPGETILELAAGAGVAGFLAASLLGGEGRLIMTDFSEEMVEAERRRGAALGVSGVEYRVMDAEQIDLEDESVDGVLCRWGYMLMADPNTALRETRRVLKPGGRLALAAWAAPEDNPWVSTLGGEVTRRGLAPPVDPDEPGQFAWAPEGVIAEQLAEAGFVEYEVDSVSFTEHYPSFDAYWETHSTMSSRLREAFAAADPAEVEALREAVREQLGDGPMDLGARTWVAVATA